MKGKSNTIKVFGKGLLTGLFLQLAVGPVFFFVISLTLQKTVWDGLAAVLAVTLVDYFYILLAILGVGKILEKKKNKRILGVVSAIVLIAFGIFIVGDTFAGEISPVFVGNDSLSLITSFSAAFILTISSPLTIIFWTSIFATKAIENSFSKPNLFVFGIATGLATFLFIHPPQNPERKLGDEVSPESSIMRTWNIEGCHIAYITAIII